MAPAPFRPKLRSVEAVIVPDPAHGRAIVLRDTEGIAPNALVVPAAYASVLSRFDGTRTVDQIAFEVAPPCRPEAVARLAEELDRAWMLDTPAFRAQKQAVVRAFSHATTRPAAHAGGAYHDDPDELLRFIEDECLAKAPGRPSRRRLRALCAPHMDLWRAAVGYGHAYRALHEALRAEIDTFILLGTSHAPMARPFAVCDKVFDTPLGALEPDGGAMRELERGSLFDVHADQYLHKTEHSLEFQAVFLKHAVGDRPVRIVPILCGLGEAQARRRDPKTDREAESFLEALGALVEARDGRALLIAGADLAHVGPRFGDARPLDGNGRSRLREADACSIELAIGIDEKGFFRQVSSDLDTRRVCGLGPIYTLLRALPRAARGELLHYDQCVDPDEGSIVSHASMAFFDG
jgi:MEMO1 family protein